MKDLNKALEKHIAGETQRDIMKDLRERAIDRMIENPTASTSPLPGLEEDGE